MIEIMTHEMVEFKFLTTKKMGRLKYDYYRNFKNKKKELKH